MQKRILYIAYFLAIAFPLMLLFRFNPNTGFYDNWYENLWVAGYYGEFFRRHLSFPVFISSNAATVGLPLPVFYGFPLYAFLGIASAVIGSNLAVRLGIFLIYAGQLIAVSSLINRITGNKKLGFAIGCLVIWATYPLTNIYNRGALPETFSTAFLTIAVALWFHLFLESKLICKIAIGVLFGFSLMMAVGS